MKINKSIKYSKNNHNYEKITLQGEQQKLQLMEC